MTKSSNGDACCTKGDRCSLVVKYLSEKNSIGNLKTTIHVSKAGGFTQGQLSGLT